MKSEITRKGYARIIIPDHYLPPDVQKPIFGTCVFDTIKMEDQFELWREHLHLPEQYKITGVFYDLGYIQWLIIIESLLLPPVPQNEYPPLYVAQLSRLENETVEISGIQPLNDGPTIPLEKKI